MSRTKHRKPRRGVFGLGRLSVLLAEVIKQMETGLTTDTDAMWTRVGKEIGEDSGKCRAMYNDAMKGQGSASNFSQIKSKNKQKMAERRAPLAARKPRQGGAGQGGNEKAAATTGETTKDPASYANTSTVTFPSGEGSTALALRFRDQTPPTLQQQAENQHSENTRGWQTSQAIDHPMQSS